MRFLRNVILAIGLLGVGTVGLSACAKKTPAPAAPGGGGDDACAGGGGAGDDACGGGGE